MHLKDFLKGHNVFIKRQFNFHNEKEHRQRKLIDDADETHKNEAIKERMSRAKKIKNDADGTNKASGYQLYSASVPRYSFSSSD